MPVLAVLCIVLSLVLRALILPRLIREADFADGAYVYRVVVRCDGAASATLYNAMGQYCKTITFSDGESVLTARGRVHSLRRGRAGSLYARTGRCAVR